MTYEKDKDVPGTVEYLIGEVDMVRSMQKKRAAEHPYQTKGMNEEEVSDHVFSVGSAERFGDEGYQDQLREWFVNEVDESVKLKIIGELKRIGRQDILDYLWIQG